MAQRSITVVEEDAVSVSRASVSLGPGGVVVQQFAITEPQPYVLLYTNSGIACNNTVSDTLQVKANSKPQSVLEFDVFEACWND